MRGDRGIPPPGTDIRAMMTRELFTVVAYMKSGGMAVQHNVPRSQCLKTVAEVMELPGIERLLTWGETDFPLDMMPWKRESWEALGKTLKDYNAFNVVTVKGWLNGEQREEIAGYIIGRAD